MIFSNKAIKAAISTGDLVIRPYDEHNIQFAHIDLHLETPDNSKKLVVPAGGFALAKTTEKITTSEKICAFMEGKASLAKQGISIEQSSTFIEPGSDNQMTLEIYNASDEAVTLNANQAISKMFVMRVLDEFK